jgi:pyruvate/2-oxoglutarate dehydrogenase complex dihydrolipoamide acyltransferase (E2) component
MIRHPITVPDLDLPSTPLVLYAWLVREGDLVVEGDRVAELSAGEVVVDLESPATGIFIQKLAAADDRVAVGQAIAWVVSRAKA